jgi:predicted nucleic acid-binding protein
MAEASGGGNLTPPRTVHDCRDYEDNQVLDLAAELGALLIVSENNDLTSMSPWRGFAVLRAAHFVGRVDAMRRQRRRQSFGTRVVRSTGIRATSAPAIGNT